MPPDLVRDEENHHELEKETSARFPPRVEHLEAIVKIAQAFSNLAIDRREPCGLEQQFVPLRTVMLAERSKRVLNRLEIVNETSPSANDVPKRSDGALCQRSFMPVEEGVHLLASLFDLIEEQ